MHEKWSLWESGIMRPDGMNRNDILYGL